MKLIEIGLDEFGVIIAKKFINNNNEIIVVGDTNDVWQWLKP